ncbi:MAG TPA: glycosyltransferase family 2 protein [Gemmatimonadaceae bacterium]|nr:glycosyltransferase family 2 protein [Gemmatimonadaceae bacterium]
MAAIPWLGFGALVWWRLRHSRDVREYAPARGANIPRVSVIVPARDEAHNIERCVESLLQTTYANVEFIVVDDHSTDGTASIAHRLIDGDARARITSAPPLPAGWFGKQWACAHGASLATGDVLLFTDADTWHAPDSLARAVTALETRNADLLTLIGQQEMHTFWEKVGQPAVFLGIFAVMGGTERMNASRDPRKKAANGQYLLMRRDVYDALGGHEAVRGYVAEDVMFAQTWTAAGRSAQSVLALDHLSTRMYRSLGEFIRGWRKNVWAGGKYLIHDHAVARAIARVVFPVTPLIGVIPHVAIALSVLGLASRWWLVFGLFGAAYQAGALALLYARIRFPVSAALLYPLGCLLQAYVFAVAAIRGDHTEWKGREYRIA